MLKVSVVIPTYNRKDLLKECLISLFSQSSDKDNYEIIVVNDGSNDGTDLPENLFVSISLIREYRMLLIWV
jgi:glycosyltransferase involved in cell wall biosynthesis